MVAQRMQAGTLWVVLGSKPCYNRDATQTVEEHEPPVVTDHSLLVEHHRRAGGLINRRSDLLKGRSR
jgi:hypothetical protein